MTIHNWNLMEWSDLKNGLKDPEGPYQEFKESAFLNKPEIYIQAGCERFTGFYRFSANCGTI